MIRSALFLAAVLGATPAFAQSESDPATGPEVGPEVGPDLDDSEDPLSPYRTRLDVLAERTIGTVSRPVAFNWRRTNVHIAAFGSFPFELNNFNTLRAGGMVRLPSEKTLVELGLSYVEVWDTPSSRLLALTPYRQPGRPNRLELDVTLAYPLAEGVVTTAPRIFPAVEMVFNGYADLRYIIYPTGFARMTPGKVAGALFLPALSDEEVDNLEDSRLDAMQTDRGRYGVLVGFGNDIYFEQGLFVSPRFLFAVPIMAPASLTELYFWADFNLAIGMAF
ncbi:MAG: hypothetical protein GWP91_16525 [Rhodobacterales bacterium]|nr:hypothetical protein [Rhodobacterales bacterium]